MFSTSNRLPGPSAALLGAALVLAACSPADTPQTGVDANPAPPAAINIYSTRHYDSDRLIYAAFEAATGVEVRAREAGAAQLIETMKAEGEASPADVIIAADAGTLWRFKDAGLTQATRSDALEAAIPARLRDPQGHWYGLAKRFRLVVYDPAKVQPGEVARFADLADPRFDGEICVRSSSNVYNLSLLGEIIEREGVEAASAWASGVAGNFARDPSGGDTDQIKAVAAGACSLAISNHYYWVRLATSGSQADRDVAAATALSWADAGNGAHVNITGGAIAANAPNRAGALAFLEFLASPEGQAMLVSETKEYPILDSVALPDGLQAVPQGVTESDLPLEALGRNQAEAQRIYDRVGWP